MVCLQFSYRDSGMKLLFKKILAMQEDGAVCFLLIFEQKYKVLLDCGINHAFDFSKYRDNANQLRDVQLVLISHSASEYSGAYPFLVSELGLSPKIVYTTQPIMRYSPLNLHEEILNLRLPAYTKKIFNRIYSQYEEMNLVKPYQKKELQLNAHPSSAIAMVNEADVWGVRKISFCCYLAGGYLGSVYWRISCGLVNILYLVDFNNYSMQHIGGLDLDNLKSQPTHLLITDVYPRLDDSKRGKLYLQLKNLVVNFYHNNYLDPTKPKTFNPEHDKKLLIACYPNELVVEIIVVLRKIVAELQQGNSNIEKIGVVHLSSRFLQLIKSQSQYFSVEFKAMLQRLNEYFEQSLGLNNRLNICSIHSIRGILSAQINQNVQIFRLGSEDYKQSQQRAIICNNLKGMRIFDEEDQRLNRSASKLSMSKIQPEQNQRMQGENEIKLQVKEEMSDELLSNSSLGEVKKLKSKYISSIGGIPRFILSKREANEEVTEFGMRNHVQESGRVERATIYDYLLRQKSEVFEDPQLSKKQSKIEVMNISFELPPESDQPAARGDFILTNVHKTQYLSSLRIIQLIRPQDIILVNVPMGPLFGNYQQDVSRIFQSFSQGRRVTIYNSNVKRNCYLSYRNELLQHKMNYLPEMQQKRVQRVKGTIFKQGNCLHIHLDCLQDKQILSFRLQKFYSTMRSRMRCRFIGSGIQIEGIKLYRVDNEIILQGEYSEEYFKVRKALYEFLQIR